MPTVIRLVKQYNYTRLSLVKQHMADLRHTNTVTSLGISRVNALEQADNYLRKQQREQQQREQLQQQGQEYQLTDQQQHSPSNRSPLFLGGMAQIFDSPSHSPNEQQQWQQQHAGNVASISPAAGSSSSSATSPRPPIHRNHSGNALASSPGGYGLTPGAPTNARNPSSVISPLARGRTNLSVSTTESTVAIEVTAGVTSHVPSNQTLLQPLDSSSVPAVSAASEVTSSGGSATVYLSPMPSHPPSSPSPPPSSASPAPSVSPERQPLLLSLPAINSSSS
jgi:hypothetical protein